MDSDVAHRRIRTALRAELKRRHGQIGQIEAELDRSEGYLSRFCRGDMELTLKGCLEVLEALEIEPGSFFSMALGSSTSPEAILGALAGDLSGDRSISLITRAVRELTGRDGLNEERSSKPARRHHLASVDELKDLPADIQMRRLRVAEKYRGESFLNEYVDWLESLRLEDPASAMRLAQTILQFVIPNAALSRKKQVEFVCKALMTYAGCARSQDKLRCAFGAIHIGLSLADEAVFPRLRADLLRRAGAFCAGISDYETGLKLSGRAVQLAAEAGDQRLLGMTLASRGILQLYSGMEINARRGFQRSVELLSAFSDKDARLSRVSAFSGLVNLCTNTGRSEEARYWLGQAISSFRADGGLVLGKLLWQRGTLERGAGDLEDAIESYQQALECLNPGSGVDCALVSVELASTLLETGRHSEAIIIAKRMASLADSLRESPSAQAAVLEFLRIVLSSGLNSAILAKLRAGLEESGRSARSARSSPPT